MNLLDNAVRHTPAGGRCGSSSPWHAGSVEISVSDSGGGIPEAERERIFERFVRLDASRGSDGAGLGLPIARVIAEAHGGSLALARSGPSGAPSSCACPAPRPVIHPRSWGLADDRSCGVVDRHHLIRRGGVARRRRWALIHASIVRVAIG